ncbi:hypothetical protein DL769_005488 [Monosporascus sp. CRB-8-3]|nr:hypothetical protein DL769_005488 [Monosporascus sp. CRB-8-3]
MIDSENLRTASLYINNQLLSRGLLRDGQSIDFADPGRCDGGVQATMGKVMSVVNDLILRRDRDAEHRESLSSTLRTLRAESQRQSTEHQRAADRLVDAQRRLDGAEATERALRAQLRAAEGSVHRLKEEAQRTRALVAQTRAACATEVRRRDRQIEGLKRAVVEAGRVRGSGSGRHNGNVTTITISGEVGGEDEALPPGATADEAYDLRMETNEFLTRLAGSLSEENEGLRALVRRAVEGLREMSGLEGAAGKGGGGDGTADAAATTQQQPQQRSAEELAAELDAVLDHLRTILTNPSFVPIEEVEVRDDEIQRLRAGFERLETRWKDAVVLIDGWRRRMGSGGRSVDVEELSAGLRLSPVRVRDVRETADAVPMNLSCVLEEDEEEEGEAYAEEQKEEVDRGHQQQEREQGQQVNEQRPRSPSPAESLHLVPAPGYDVREGDENGSESSSIFEDDIDMDELEAEEPNVQVLQESTWRRSMEDSPPLPEPPELSPLKDSYSSGNRGSGLNSNAQPHPKKPGDFTTIIEEKTWELAAATATEDEVPPVPPPHTVDYRRRSQEKPGNESKENKLRPSELVLSTDSRSDLRSTAYDSPLFGRSGEKPSMSDPSKKLFSKPSRPAKESPNKQEPEQKAKQSDHSKSAPGTPNTSSGRRPQTRSSTKRVASNPNPPPAPEQQPSQPSPAPTNKSTASSKSASAQNETPQSKPTSTAAITAAATQSRNPSPVRNNGTNPQTTSSRLPRRNNSAAPQQQTPLTMETIAAKLAAAEREADAARVRAKLRAARLGKRVTAARNGGAKQASDGTGAKGADSTATANSTTATTTSQAHQPEPREREQQQQRERERRQAAVNPDLEDVDPVKKDMNNNNNNNTYPRPLPPAPASPWRNNNTNDNPDADELAAASPEIEIKVQKRKRDRRTSAAVAASRRASRRRSTLSPWELESLIQGGVAVESPAR